MNNKAKSDKHRKLPITSLVTGSDLILLALFFTFEEIIVPHLHVPL